MSRQVSFFTVSLIFTSIVKINQTDVQSEEFNFKLRPINAMIIIVMQSPFSRGSIRKQEEHDFLKFFYLFIF